MKNILFLLSFVLTLFHAQVLICPPKGLRAAAAAEAAHQQRLVAALGNAQDNVTCEIERLTKELRINYEDTPQQNFTKANYNIICAEINTHLQTIDALIASFNQCGDYLKDCKQVQILQILRAEFCQQQRRLLGLWNRHSLKNTTATAVKNNWRKCIIVPTGAAVGYYYGFVKKYKVN